MDKLSEEQRDLVVENMRLVHHIVKRYSTPVPTDEIVSAGYYGLVKASKTFNPDRGSKFSTYAGICITNSILDLLSEYKNKRRRALTSIDDPIVYDDKLGNLKVSDLYDDGERIEDDYIRKADTEELRFFIGLYLLDKSPRYTQIIRLRLQGKTHEVIAKELGISKSYISRILTRIERELTALKNKIDKTNGSYIKRYSVYEIERARYVLQDSWTIQIERSSFDPQPPLKNKSVHPSRPSVNFLQKGLCFNSDLVNLIDPDSEKLDIMFTKSSDTNGVIIFKFRKGDAPYFLQLKQSSSCCAYIESSSLTTWLKTHHIIPGRYSTCYYDDAESVLYVKVECAQDKTK